MEEIVALPFELVWFFLLSQRLTQAPRSQQVAWPPSVGISLYREDQKGKRKKNWWHFICIVFQEFLRVLCMCFFSQQISENFSSYSWSTCNAFKQNQSSVNPVIWKVYPYWGRQVKADWISKRRYLGKMCILTALWKAWLFQFPPFEEAGFNLIQKAEFCILKKVWETW